MVSRLYASRPKQNQTLRSNWSWQLGRRSGLESSRMMNASGSRAQMPVQAEAQTGAFGHKF